MDSVYDEAHGKSRLDRLIHWIREVDNVEGSVALGLGGLMILQPIANSFHNSFVSVTIGFLFLWVAVSLLVMDGGNHIFFTSIILRTLHLSALVIEASSNLASGHLLFVVISVGSIVYAFIKKLDDIEHDSNRD